MALSLCTYRIWIFTSPEDEGGSKGHVSICLGGALGEKWLMHVDAAIPPEELFRAGRYCEFFQEAEDVGKLHTLTVGYDAVEDGAAVKPWRLSHAVVRSSSSGMVYHFPASVTLTGEAHRLQLAPRLVWHEDRYGNFAEAPPPPPTTGRWLYPMVGVPTVTGGALEVGTLSEEQRLVLEHGELGVAMLDCICRDEVLPLVEMATHDLRLQRTPGTFLHDCLQAVHGVPVGGPTHASLDELRRKNLELSSKIHDLEGKRDSETAETWDQLTSERQEAARVAAQLQEARRALALANERAQQAAKQPPKSSVCAVS